MVIGVLALQGGFALHLQRLQELGADTREVRTEADLRSLDGLIIPGGESSTLLKLLDSRLKDSICSLAAAGMPVLATCAGAILLAREVLHPRQESLSLIDVTIERNAYGRQINSFIESGLTWTPAGRALLASLGHKNHPEVEAVFIRAPKIARTGKEVQVLMTRAEEAVLVKQGNILAATYHPELSENGKAVHELFLELSASRFSKNMNSAA